MKRKVKRYDEGGKTEEQYKKAGLESSKDEKVGFFERLRMGNIDDPSSEAYRRFGAGRAKINEEAKRPVPEMNKMSSDYSGRNVKSYVDDGMNVPHSTASSKKMESDSEAPSLTERLRRASSGSNISKADGEGGGYTSPVKEEVKPKKPKLRKRISQLFPVDTAGMKKRRKESSEYSMERETKPGSGAYGFKSGGKVSASSRADGIAQRGKTRGRIC
jgi:hypothetical protein